VMHYFSGFCSELVKILKSRTTTYSPEIGASLLWRTIQKWYVAVIVQGVLGVQNHLKIIQPTSNCDKLDH
jgi:hypothetical protein